MTDKIDFKLSGVDDAVKRLRQFAPKLQKKGLRSAARKAMNIVRDAARETARGFDEPETPTKIYKLITTQESTRGSKRVGGVMMRVGILGGAKRSKDRDPPWYWRLIEFGDEFTPAKPFMRPALANNIGRVTDKFSTELNSEIDKLT